MKKVLRIVLFLIVFIIAGVLILGIFAPKEMSVECSIEINAPKEAVAKQMLRFSNFNKWNPWFELDTTMTWELSGEDGANGSKYSWKGNSDVGSGEMSMSDVSADKLNYTLNFKEPWESHATGYWKIEDAGNGKSKAIWGFTTHNNYPSNGLMMIMGMKGMLSKDFNKGLDKLKKFVESQPKAAEFNIESIDFPAQTYAILKGTVKISDAASMSTFFSNSYQMLGQSVGQYIIGNPVALFYTWDEQSGTTNLAAGFPIKAEVAPSKVALEKVAASKGFKITYIGGYYGSGKAHEAMDAHISKSGAQKGLVLEEYVKGPGTEPDSNKWITNIIYLIK